MFSVLLSVLVTSTVFTENCFSISSIKFVRIAIHNIKKVLVYIFLGIKRKLRKALQKFPEERIPQTHVNR